MMGTMENGFKTFLLTGDEAALVDAGKVIEAIKSVRARCACGLLEAKRSVDEYRGLYPRTVTVPRDTLSRLLAILRDNIVGEADAIKHTANSLGPVDPYFVEKYNGMLKLRDEINEILS